MDQRKHFNWRSGCFSVAIGAKGRKIWLTEDSGNRRGELGARWEVVRIQCGQCTITLSIEIMTETQ